LGLLAVVIVVVAYDAEGDVEWGGVYSNPTPTVLAVTLPGVV
jgi:hypothetical protein